MKKNILAFKLSGNGCSSHPVSSHSRESKRSGYHPIVEHEMYQSLSKRNKIKEKTIYDHHAYLDVDKVWPTTTP